MKLAAFQSAQLDSEKVKLRKQVQELQAQLQKILLEKDQIAKGFDFQRDVMSSKLIVPPWHPLSKKPSKGKAVVSAFLSDTHYDEWIDAAQVAFMNEYNRSIAEKRTQNFFDNIVTLSKHYLSGMTYDGLVLSLGGDILSGSIHEELVETNEAPILESVLHWTEQLISGIEFISKHFNHVQIPCVVGNHGRRSKKPRSKGRVQDNFDWLIYMMLQRHFKDNDKISFLISPSADQRYQIYDTRFLLTHGDQFRGGSGISGLKCVTPETSILMSDLSYMPAGDLEIGNSLVGFDEFGSESSERACAGRRKFKESFVTAVERKKMECMEIETEDGVKTIASLEHPWLTRSSSAHAWSRTENIHIGTRILTLGAPWTRNISYDAGYLAGVLDGEGHIEVGRHNCRIGFAQQDNGCLTRALEILDKLSIPRTSAYNKNTFSKGYEKVYNVRLFGGSGKSTYHILRLLGEIGPRRLLEEKGRRVWEGRSVQICKEARVVGLRYVGSREVAAFSTSTATFVANGLLTHNSPLFIGDR